jgi:hypothetical protein
MYQRRFGQHPAQVARSQIAVRLGLVLYAMLGTAFALRCMVLVFHFPDTVWTVQQILSLTAPLLRPLRFLPGASRSIAGEATLADLTIMLLLVAVPLALLARPGPSSGSDRT